MNMNFESTLLYFKSPSCNTFCFKVLIQRNMYKLKESICNSDIDRMYALNYFSSDNIFQIAHYSDDYTLSQENLPSYHFCN